MDVIVGIDNTVMRSRHVDRLIVVSIPWYCERLKLFIRSDFKGFSLFFSLNQLRTFIGCFKIGG